LVSAAIPEEASYQNKKEFREIKMEMELDRAKECALEIEAL